MCATSTPAPFAKRACRSRRHRPSCCPRAMPAPRCSPTWPPAKYQDALPLYRQSQIFPRYGAEIPRNTLARWMVQAGERVPPLIEGAPPGTLLGIGHGWQITQRAVRSNMVVVDPPLGDFVSCIRQAKEPVLIEAAVSELAVEALDECILRRLAWLDEGQRHCPLTCPEEHRFAGQLWSVIADNRGRQWHRCSRPEQPLTPPDSGLKTRLAVQPVGPLAIGHQALLTQQGMQQQVAIAGIASRQGL